MTRDKNSGAISCLVQGQRWDDHTDNEGAKGRSMWYVNDCLCVARKFSLLQAIQRFQITGVFDIGRGLLCGAQPRRLLLPGPLI